MKIFEVTSYEDVIELKKRVDVILAKLKFSKIVYRKHFIDD